MSDTVLDLLASAPSPEMHVDEAAVVTRGRVRVRRRRWARATIGGVAAACAGLAVAAWPLLTSDDGAVAPADVGTPTASTSAPAVTNPPNTSARQPVPCGKSAKLFADTKDNFLGGDVSRRVVVHTGTCQGAMISAGTSDPSGARWVAGYAPAARSGMPDRAFFVVLAEPSIAPETTSANLVAYAALPPNSDICGWSADGYTPPRPPGDGPVANDSPSGEGSTVIGLDDGWTAVIAGLDNSVAAASWRMDVCDRSGTIDDTQDSYTVAPVPVVRPAG
ncbi:MAG: hypothetical protein ACRCYR_04680 [Phycicoccus sp.]